MLERLAYTVAGTYFVLFEPFLEQLLPTLLKYRARKFDRLEVVQFTLFKKNAEVLQDGRQATGGCWSLLEGFDNSNSA